MRFDPQANRVGGLDESAPDETVVDLTALDDPARRGRRALPVTLLALAVAGTAGVGWWRLHGDREVDAGEREAPALSMSPQEVLGEFSLSRTSSARAPNGRKQREAGGSTDAPSTTRSSDGAPDAAASGSSEARTALAAGRRALNMRRYRDAIPHLKRAVALNPSLADARYNLGLAYTQTGRNDLARAQREALQPLDRNLANLLGVLLEE